MQLISGWFGTTNWYISMLLMSGAFGSAGVFKVQKPFGVKEEEERREDEGGWMLSPELLTRM